MSSLRELLLKAPVLLELKKQRENFLVDFELTEIRFSSRRLFNKRSGSSDDGALYKAGLVIYKFEFKKAYRAFCGSVEGCREKSATPLGYLRNVDSGKIASSEESMNLLLDAHFPLNRSAKEVPLGSFDSAVQFAWAFWMKVSLRGRGIHSNPSSFQTLIQLYLTYASCLFESLLSKFC